MARKRDGFLMVQPIATSDDGARWPMLPEGWSAEPQSGGWVELVRGSDRLASYVGNTNAAGDRGLFLVLGPRTVLSELAGSMEMAAPVRKVWEQAVAGPGTARDVIRRWRDWRFDGRRRLADGTVVTFVGEAYRLMADEGYSLPDPAVKALPWNLDRNGQITTQAAAVFRVEGNLRPTLLASMAAPYDDAADAEATT